jgi:hypothetical protein
VSSCIGYGLGADRRFFYSAAIEGGGIVQVSLSEADHFAVKALLDDQPGERDQVIKIRSVDGVRFAVWY